MLYGRCQLALRTQPTISCIFETGCSCSVLDWNDGKTIRGRFCEKTAVVEYIALLETTSKGYTHCSPCMHRTLEVPSQSLHTCIACGERVYDEPTPLSTATQKWKERTQIGKVSWKQCGRLLTVRQAASRELCKEPAGQ